MPITSWHLIMKFSKFIQHCLLNLYSAWSWIIFDKGEVTDVLEWPPKHFYIMKTVCTENFPLRKITSIKWCQQVSDSAFTVNVQCVYPRFSTNLQLLWKLINCLRELSLSIKKNQLAFLFGTEMSVKFRKICKILC